MLSALPMDFKVLGSVLRLTKWWLSSRHCTGSEQWLFNHTAGGAAETGKTYYLSSPSQDEGRGEHE